MPLVPLSEETPLPPKVVHDSLLIHSSFQLLAIPEDTSPSLEEVVVNSRIHQQADLELQQYLWAACQGHQLRLTKQCIITSPVAQTISVQKQLTSLAMG